MSSTEATGTTWSCDECNARRRTQGHFPEGWATVAVSIGEGGGDRADLCGECRGAEAIASFAATMFADLVAPVPADGDA